jgi:hypothetical protein
MVFGSVMSLGIYAIIVAVVNRSAKEQMEPTNKRQYFCFLSIH